MSRRDEQGPSVIQVEHLPERGRFADSRLAHIFRSTARGNLKFGPTRWLQGRVLKGRQHRHDEPED